MARPRTLPDSDVFAAILQMIAAEGEKAVAFSAVARATGLAGASLVQRYGPLPQMVEAALTWGWDTLDAMAADAEAEVAATEQASGKGGHKGGQKAVQAVLKALGDKVLGGTDQAGRSQAGRALGYGPAVPMAALLAASLRHATLRHRAADWRERVEAMLTVRLRDRDLSGMVFAAWQGQVLWESLGDKSFRLKDLLKKLD